MRPIIPDYLAEVLGDVEPDASGEPAGYIPELATADTKYLGAAFAMLDGEVYGSGDIDIEFTIQSISKPFVYALALSDRGFDSVLAKVGVEPSGEAFNEISLESDTGRPLNPMISSRRDHRPLAGRRRGPGSGRSRGARTSRPLGVRRSSAEDG